jgi:glycosyltransferase involved in cell wall biosynthesis
MSIVEEKPLLTFALIAYNQEQFIAEAVQGAFSQTYSPLEIILSDDCSPDRTFEIMQEMMTAYQGPHKIVLNRNKRNLGIGAHINRVMELAHGQLIVIAAGDDVSLPHRTERIWQEYVFIGRKAYSIFSNEYLIDELGNKCALTRQNPPDPKKLTRDWFTQRQSSVTGSSQAWRRDVFDLFGPLGDGVVSEDVVIPFRSLLLGSIHYIHEPLVLRRYTGKNLALDSLQQWDSHASVDRFRDKTYRHTKNFIAVYETRLSDIDKLWRAHPERQDELGIIRAVTEKKLHRVREELRFWEASNLKKFRMLFQDFIRNGFGTTAIRLFLSWVFPSFYLRWYHLIWFSQQGKLTQI